MLSTELSETPWLEFDLTSVEKHILMAKKYAGFIFQQEWLTQQ